MTVRGILCDLDGVVYRGERACPGAVEGLTAARAAGVRVLFMTNNASRPPAEVARHISDLGLPTTEQDVLGASQVAATVLANEQPELLGSGVDARPSAVLAVGGPGVALALREAGLHAVAVPVWGYGSDVVAALSAAGPAYRFPRRRARAVVPQLREAAAQLSAHLGHVDPAH